MVVAIEAYFDEPSSEDEHTLLDVSGYIFDKEGCLRLDREWAVMLTGLVSQEIVSSGVRVAKKQRF